MIPGKNANAGSAPLAIAALGEALKALRLWARGMRERPRTRWERMESPTPAAGGFKVVLNVSTLQPGDSYAHAFW